MSLIDFVEVKWRTDEKDPCVIRAITGHDVAEVDPRIGFMQTIQIAREVVQTHNARLESR